MHRRCTHLSPTVPVADFRFGRPVCGSCLSRPHFPMTESVRLTRGIKLLTENIWHARQRGDSKKEIAVLIERRAALQEQRRQHRSCKASPKP